MGLVTGPPEHCLGGSSSKKYSIGLGEIDLDKQDLRSMLYVSLRLVYPDIYSLGFPKTLLG